MKTCKECNEVKNLEDFHRDKTLKDGRKNRCKTCQIDRTTAWGRENTEKRTAAQGRWRGSNPAKARSLSAAQSARRRSRRMEAETGYLTGDYYGFVMAYYKSCANCGSTNDKALDHIIPLASGGSHTLLNFQRLCKSCNSAKGAHHSTDYRTGPVLAWFVPPRTISLNNFEQQNIALM